MKKLLILLGMAGLLAIGLFSVSPSTGSLLNPQTAGACGSFSIYDVGPTYTTSYYDPILGYSVSVNAEIVGYTDGCRNWEFETLMWGPGEGTGLHQGIYNPVIDSAPSGDPGVCSPYTYTAKSDSYTTVVWSSPPDTDDDNFCGVAASTVQAGSNGAWFYSEDTGIWYSLKPTWP